MYAATWKEIVIRVRQLELLVLEGFMPSDSTNHTVAILLDGYAIQALII